MFFYMQKGEVLMARYRNPKNTKQEIKLMFFYLIDGAIFISTIFFGNAFFNLFNLSPTMNVVSYGFLVVLGFWLCLRTNAHPVDRNLFMIFHLLKSDKNKYYEISTDYYENIYKVKRSKE